MSPSRANAVVGVGQLTGVGRLLLSPWVAAALAVGAAVLLTAGRGDAPSAARRTTVQSASVEQPDAGEYLVRDYRDILDQEAGGGAVTGFGPIASVGGKLALVLALAVVLGWVVQRWQAAPSVPAGAPPGLRRLESLALSPQASVHVVEVGSRLLVVGVTAQQVSLLTELEADDLGSAPEGDAPSPSFLNLLDLHRTHAASAQGAGTDAPGGTDANGTRA